VARAWREGEEGGEGLPGGCVREHLALQVSVHSTKHRFQQHETCVLIPVKSPYFFVVTLFRHERLVLGGGDEIRVFVTLKGLSHEIDFKNVDSNLQNLA